MAGHERAEEGVATAPLLLGTHIFPLFVIQDVDAREVNSERTRLPDGP
jgi:hypothetical protein